VRVLLADDHEVVLDGLRAVLAGERSIEVVGAAKDGLAAIEQTVELQPDVLILDLMMPGMGGFDVARELRARAPATRIVFLSMHSAEAYVAQALERGATAYVLKSAPSRELVEAIHAAFRGRSFLSSGIDKQLVGRLRAAGTTDAADGLTLRERHVLKLIAEGQTNQEIASALGIGRRTVEFHRANLMQKLGAQSQAELVRYAVRAGLVPA
jgi:DNA-binding NarL/FixJ family response regulator